MQSAPGPFEGLEVGVMDDRIDLQSQLPVDLRDDALDRADGIVGDHRHARQRLLGERLDGPLDRGFRHVRFRLELFFQKAFELGDLNRRARRLRFQGFFWVSHGRKGSGVQFCAASVGFGAAASDLSTSGSFKARAMSCSAPSLPSIYESRLESCVRASSSLRKGSTFRAIAAGEKSFMLSNVTSTLRLPSPVSVFGTWNATCGFIALRRSSKFSASISRNLRSCTGARGSTGLPVRSASTPMTNGSSIFF